MKISIAIIPARGGSKRIPGKNIRDFCGAPMISYPIAAALESKLFNRVVVSTDSADIAQVSEKYGAEFIMRDNNLADDHSTSDSAVLQTLDSLSVDSDTSIACIYPTTPFLSAEEIRGSANVFERTPSRMVLGVGRVPFPLERVYIKVSDERLLFRQSEHYFTRSQDLPAHYFDAGAIAWGDPKQWRDAAENGILECSYFELSRVSSVDIDIEEDWRFAEILYKGLRRT